MYIAGVVLVTIKTTVKEGEHDNNLVSKVWPTESASEGALLSTSNVEINESASEGDLVSTGDMVTPRNSENSDTEKISDEEAVKQSCASHIERNVDDSNEQMADCVSEEILKEEVKTCDNSSEKSIDGLKELGNLNSKSIEATGENSEKSCDNCVDDSNELGNLKDKSIKEPTDSGDQAELNKTELSCNENLEQQGGSGDDGQKLKN